MLGMSKAVEDWIYTISDSALTRSTYRGILRKFSRIMRLDLDKLVRKWKGVKYDPIEKEKFVDIVSGKVQKYYSYSLQRKLASGTVKNRYTAVKSFFHFHDIPINVKTRTHVFVTYHNRQISKEEIKRILEQSGQRERTFYLMMLESGQRPNTLAKLQYKHIKEDYEAHRIPMKIDLPSNIIKDRLGFRFTYIGNDAYKALREYLKARGILRDDDYIFVREKKLHIDSATPITPNTFGNYFSRLALRLGIAERREKGKPKAINMYCLRKFFRNHCTAEVSYREFWMAHSLGTDEHYLTRDVEVHRKKYSECYDDLRLFPTSQDAFAELRGLLKNKEQEIMELKDNQAKLAPLLDFVKGFETEEKLKRFLDLLKSSSVITFPQHETTLVRWDCEGELKERLEAAAKETGMSEDDLIHAASKLYLKHLEKKRVIPSEEPSKKT